MNDGLYGLLKAAIDTLPTIIAATGGTIAAIGVYKSNNKQDAAKLQVADLKGDMATSNRNQEAAKVQAAELKGDVANNTEISTQAKDQAGAAFEVGAQGLTVANGVSHKFFEVHAELKRQREITDLQEQRIERHRLANIEQLRIFRQALEALQAHDLERAAAHVKLLHAAEKDHAGEPTA